MDLDTKKLMLRACVYPSPDEPDTFVAHCIELDIMGSGHTIQETLDELMDLTNLQIQTCQEHGAQLIFLAPSHIWGIYQAAYKANRRLPDELMHRVIQEANRRLGHRFDESFFQDVFADENISRECLMTV